MLATRFVRRTVFLLLCIAFLLGLELPTLAVGPNQDDPAGTLAQVDTLVKITGGAIAGIVALFGIPLTYFQIKKTKAEIRKLEKEAEDIQANSAGAGFFEGNRISIENSDHAVVQILADPRFLAPLLLILDFVIAWIILTLAGYALGIFDSLFGLSQLFRSLMFVAMGAFLLIPLVREALRVRRVLRPESNSRKVNKGRID